MPDAFFTAVHYLDTTGRQLLARGFSLTEVFWVVFGFCIALTILLFILTARA